jgi:hypothetical protein
MFTINSISPFDWPGLTICFIDIKAKDNDDAP